MNVCRCDIVVAAVAGGHVFAIFALPQPLEELGVSRGEIVGSDAGLLEVSDYIADHLADAEFLMGAENFE